MDEYAQMLFVTNPLREPVFRKAISILHLPQGSSGLDVGCGIGLQSRLLAEAVGLAGHITGLDSSETFLALAEKFTNQTGLRDRISYQLGDWRKLPFEDACFDWVWSADAAGYAASDPLREIGELRRVVKPGGIVAILCWSSQMLLPGYPALEARLNATSAGIAPFSNHAPPGNHYLRMLGWLREAGLEQMSVETIVQSAFAPLTEDQRSAISSLFKMRWGSAEEEISPEDWNDYQRLCQPGSKDFILNCQDYYSFFIYSLFYGYISRD